MDIHLKKNKSIENIHSSPKPTNNKSSNKNNNINNNNNNNLNNNQDSEILLKNNNNNNTTSNKDQQKPAINDLLFKYFFKLDKEASKRGFTEYGGSDNEKESNESKFVMGSPVLIKKNKKIQKQEIY